MDAQVVITTRSPEERAAVSDMLRRTAAALSALDTFVSSMTRIDEDDEHAMEDVIMILRRLAATHLALYPHGGEQAVSDIDALEAMGRGLMGGGKG